MYLLALLSLLQPAPTCLQVHRSVSFSPLTLPSNRSLRIYVVVFILPFGNGFPPWTSQTLEITIQERALLSVVKE